MPGAGNPKVIYRGYGPPPPGTIPTRHGGYGHYTGKHTHQQIEKTGGDDQQQQELQDQPQFEDQPQSQQFTPGTFPAGPPQPSLLEQLQQQYGGGGGGAAPWSGQSWEDQIADDADEIDADVDDGLEHDGGDAMLGMVDQLYYRRERDYEGLTSSVARGRWGFSFTLPLGQQFTQQVMSAEVSPEECREWTIVLCAFRFTGGTLTSTEGGIPPDNQITASGALLTNLKVKVEWGVDGAFESCLMDYPSRGFSFGLAAASIRISLVVLAPLNTSGTFLAPLVGGFIVPQGKSSSASDYDQPTFSQPFLLTGGPANTPLFLPVPDRARAYRIMPGGVAGVGNFIATSTLQAQQVDGITGTTQYSDDTVTGAGGAGSLVSNFPAQTITRAKVNPGASALRLATIGAAAPILGGFVVWDLDLG